MKIIQSTCTMWIVFVIQFPFTISSGYSQTTIKVNAARDIIDKRTINNYNKKQTNKILDVGKYIDTTKKIWIVVGSNSFGVMLDQLRAGYSFAPFKTGFSFISGSEKVIILKLVKGKLKVSSDIYGFDGKYIVNIRDNKIIPSKADYHAYISDRYLEFFDDYYIPVLQIELQKMENSIYIGGAFNFDMGYYIVTKKGMDMRYFSESKYDMPQSRRDSLFGEYLISARAIPPIHE